MVQANTDPGRGKDFRKTRFTRNTGENTHRGGLLKVIVFSCYENVMHGLGLT